MKKIIFATHNQGKVIEMRQILAGLNVELITAEEAGVLDDVLEDGKTFADNAFKKAKFVVAKTNEWALADDSGLCIDALGGKPGVYSARWAKDKDIVEHTLGLLKNVPKPERGAYFETCAVLLSPQGKKYVFSGVVKGEISLTPKGRPVPKLPYDVIFIPSGQTKTFAEMDKAEKNKLSHRGLALQKMIKVIKKLI